MLDLSRSGVAWRRCMIAVAVAMPAVVSVTARAHTVAPATGRLAITQPRDVASRPAALASKVAPMVVAELSASNDPTSQEQFGPDMIHSWSPR